MKKNFRSFRDCSFTLALLIGSWLLAPFALAQGQGLSQTTTNINNALNSAGQTGFGQSTTTVPTLGNLVGRYVTVFLGFVGTIAFVVFLYGGYLWLTARGNDEQVEQAKKYVFNGVAGIVIIVLAYSAAFFITSQLYSQAR